MAKKQTVEVDIKTVVEGMIPKVDKENNPIMKDGKAQLIKGLHVEAKIGDAEMLFGATLTEGKTMKSLAKAVVKEYKRLFREELMGEIEVEL